MIRVEVEDPQVIEEGSQAFIAYGNSEVEKEEARHRKEMREIKELVKPFGGTVMTRVTLHDALDGYKAWIEKTFVDIHGRTTQTGKKQGERTDRIKRYVQDKLLNSCNQLLAANGVAYVSFNTYPGWHMRRAIRDLMCFHAEQFPDPYMRIGQVRDLLDVLATSAPAMGNSFGTFLQTELESIRRSEDWYLFHEHLEPVNEPFYFHEYARRAANFDLRYLGDADFATMSTHSFPAEVRQRLNLLTGDALRLEQYKDFFWNRPFRQTLLCHANAPVRNEVGPSEVTGFFIASPARPVSSSPDLHSTAVEQFRAPSGLTLHSAEPIGKAAMVHLAEMWPQPIQFDQLLAAAREKLGQPMATALDTEKLAGMLLAAYTIGATKLMEFRTHTPAFILQPGEFPVASPLARWQARTSSSVTNLRHERLTLDDFDRSTLPYLDGRNNREALLKVHIDRAVRGELRLHRSGQPIVSKSAMHSALEEVLTVQLTRLSRMALLQS